MKLQKIYVNDNVRVVEDKIKYLFYSNPIYLVEDFSDPEPELFLKRSIGKVIESDWDHRKNEWSFFVELYNKRNNTTERLWFLEYELYLI